jgi:NAD(P)-dependent dehydrogenase (short-subunit alcohol dehydrogenase family)
MAGRVQGKVAIVTGAASGIGQATAELLASEGASVVVADMNAEGAERVAAGIRAVSEFGGLHILHNNAAMTAGHEHANDLDLLTMTVDYWDRSFSVNLRGAMLGAKHAIPVMIAGGGGAIVNTSSNQSLGGDLSQFAYSAAKAGVNALTRSIATTYGRRGIRCNTVSPGHIETPTNKASVSPEMSAAIVSNNLIPRAGRADDLAHAVLYLVSDESSFVTGQLISIDGGQMAHLPHYSYLIASGAKTTNTAG